MRALVVGRARYRPSSGSAHQFPLYRNWITEEVKYRAVGVNCCSQFFVASRGFRPTEVDPDANGIEAGPDTIIDTQEST